MNNQRFNVTGIEPRCYWQSFISALYTSPSFMWSKPSPSPFAIQLTVFEKIAKLKIGSAVTVLCWLCRDYGKRDYYPQREALTWWIVNNKKINWEFILVILLDLKVIYINGFRFMIKLKIWCQLARKFNLLVLCVYRFSIHQIDVDVFVKADLDWNY